MSRKRTETILVFDLSTVGRFPQQQLRFGYVYDVEQQEFEYYPVEHAGRLIARLQKADVVISYNGSTFDVPLLRKRYGLKGKFPFRGEHIDLRQIGLTGGLNKWADSELGDQKHHVGKSLESLQEACQHDILLTLQLWELYESELLPGQVLPPSPLLIDRLDAVDEEMAFENMSEGELAEYLALVEGGGDDAWGSEFLGVEI